MSDFFEIFQPGLRYLRDQLETEKLLFVQDAQGGSGPDPLDLESGRVVLRMPAHPQSSGTQQQEREQPEREQPDTPQPDSEEGPDQ